MPDMVHEALVAKYGKDFVKKLTNAQKNAIYLRLKAQGKLK